MAIARARTHCGLICGVFGGPDAAQTVCSGRRRRGIQAKRPPPILGTITRRSIPRNVFRSASISHDTSILNCGRSGAGSGFVGLPSTRSATLSAAMMRAPACALGSRMTASQVSATWARCGFNHAKRRPIGDRLGWPGYRASRRAESASWGACRALGHPACALGRAAPAGAVAGREAVLVALCEAHRRAGTRPPPRGCCRSSTATASSPRQRRRRWCGRWTPSRTRTRPRRWRC